MTKFRSPARYMLGALFLVFGLNFFFGFLPMPAPNAAEGAFLGAIAGTGYLFQVIKIIEVLVGVMLLADLFVPLALVLIAPITVNIFLVHLMLDQSGLPVALVVLALNLFLGIAYLANYKTMLKMKA